MGAPGLVVVGGGPAGCAAAAAACADGLDVVLYTAGPSPRMRPVESLPPGTAELVNDIFGPGVFRPDDHLPAYANRSRWGSNELETADFVFNPFGHGWHVRRPAFDAALLDAVRTMGVRVLERRLRTAPAAAFVIDASGRSARIARTRGARRMRSDGLVAVFRETAHTGSTTTVVAAENGWTYTSPGISAFLTDADLLPRLTGCVTDASTSWLDRIAGPGVGRDRRCRGRLRSALLPGNRHRPRRWDAKPPASQRGSSVLTSTRPSTRPCWRSTWPYARSTTGSSGAGPTPPSGGGGRTRTGTAPWSTAAARRW